ncbi:AAA family ATPase [Microbispora bryophytorum]|uniref:AAA family ATPase n=1 Tax=Microbispora bryophytorum TaxID=1460882 RepID=UPI0033C68831
MLYGRSAETAAIDDLIDRAGKGHGGALVLRGEAGAGKTALLDLAASRGGPMRVLRTTGVEAEADLAFAALHQLLLPVAGLLDALPEPQAEAVRGALGLAPAGSGDRFLLAAGVLSLLAEAAAPNGLICVVDDLQWVDRPSADALLFAARRLRTEPIAMPLAVRGDAPVKGLPSLEIAGLAQPAAAELLDAGFALAAPDRRDLVALTGGNPLALHETARLLTAAQRAGREPLPDPLPGGSRLFGDRVAALSPGARLTALLAAVESDLGLVLRAAERLGAGDAALPELESAGLAGVSGTHVRFRHPLIRSAVYEAASPAARREAHAALAEVSGGDRRAWHLAGAALGQDEPVAAALALAAERARDRGGYGAAATALTRAAELTPEPLVRAGRLKDAAVAAWLGGRPGQAESLLAEARELAGVDTALTMEIARLRGRFELNSGNAAEAVRILAAGDTLDMLADASEAASYVGDTAAMIEVGRRAAAFPEGFLRDVVAGIGATLAGGGGHDLLRRALGRTGELREAAEFLWATAAASHLGEVDLSSELAERAGRVARVSGMTGQLPVVLEFVATAERLAQARRTPVRPGAGPRRGSQPPAGRGGEAGFRADGRPASDHGAHLGRRGHARAGQAGPRRPHRRGDPRRPPDDGPGHGPHPAARGARGTRRRHTRPHVLTLRHDSPCRAFGTTRPPLAFGTTRPPLAFGTTRPPLAFGTTRPPLASGTTGALALCMIANVVCPGQRGRPASQCKITEMVAAGQRGRLRQTTRSRGGGGWGVSGR